MNYLYYIMFIVSYLIGSLSFAIIVSKLMKMDDPRSYGSNNAGATNVMRSGNKKAAVFTLLGDLLKGFVVVLVAQRILPGVDESEAIVGICGMLVVLGHVFPIFFKFKGGKGVASAIGVMLGFSSLLALLLIITWFVVFKVSRVSSLAAVLATLLSPLYAYVIFNGNTAYFGATLMIAVLVVLKHRTNIVRLLKGDEHIFKKSSAANDAKHSKSDDN